LRQGGIAFAKATAVLAAVLAAATWSFAVACCRWFAPRVLRLAKASFASARRGVRSVGHQSAREIARIKGPQVVQPLPHADELHGQPELLRDRDGDAALGRAVDLRYADGAAEEACLLDTVLAGRRIDHEQRLVRGAVEAARDHPAHLAELVHQVRLRVQPAGGVDNYDVASGSDRVVGDRSGVGAPLAADEAGSGALRPDLELLLRGGPERVCGADYDVAAVLAKLVRELAHPRRLPRAVDADDEDDGRVVVYV